MGKTKAALQKYVDAASDLADSVKSNIQHNDGQISNDTVLLLNRFVIAANEIAHLTNQLKFEDDPNLQ
jgi:hypothetical protein